MKKIALPYTLCFPIISENILLLYRKNKPNANLWNGIGGKIKTEEEAINCLYREVKEESNIDLSSAQIQYSGIVCWNKTENDLEGMYCFLTYPSPDMFFSNNLATEEGILAWKKIEWVINKKNKQVASNLPYFLPHMLSNTNPYLYRCIYHNGKLEKFTIDNLSEEYILE